ncbi:amidohydrolase family protein [Stieleria marina]|uniref:N-acyl-D-glutamate deacylase n=1 Tax=Stieleria marina TaxID=1930275 RepID=A0A517NRA7_9BACT|nr:N-acyl-D-glutamate deacylase [Planctomycetes bacterium K23_9]
MYRECRTQSCLIGLIIAFFPLGMPVLFNTGPAYSQEMNKIAAPQPDSVVAIVGGKLIDGNGGRPLQNSCIVIRGNQIVAVGSRHETPIPKGAKVFDAGGKSVLPGLIDTHFHSRDSVEQPVNFELHNGVTSFRDPGHPFKYYTTLLASDARIPRVFLCGGHLDAPPVVWPDQAAVITTEDEARQAVASHVDRGASAIKVYFRLPIEHIRAACQAAHDRHVPVTAHLELVDADDAIEAGVSGIEHITSFGTSIGTSDQVKQFKSMVSADSGARREWRYRLWAQVQLEKNPRVGELIDLIVQRGVFVSPTLAVFERRAGKKDATAAEAAGFKNMLSFSGRCHKAGAKLVVGSHTWVPFAAQGKAYLREVELLVEAGMKPLDVLTSATKTGAEFLGVDDRLGTIETGKLADLIVVDGDPTTKISDLGRVTKVMLNGQWVDLPSQ